MNDLSCPTIAMHQRAKNTRIIENPYAEPRRGYGLTTPSNPGSEALPNTKAKELSARKKAMKESANKAHFLGFKKLKMGSSRL